MLALPDMEATWSHDSDVEIIDSNCHSGPRSESTSDSPSNSDSDSVNTTTSRYLVPSIKVNPVSTPYTSSTEVSSNNNVGNEVSSWTPGMVQDYFLSHGFESDICSKFKYHDITGSILLNLEVSELKEIDIFSYGIRLKISAEIKSLQQGQVTSSPSLNSAIQQPMNSQSTTTNVPLEISQISEMLSLDSFLPSSPTSMQNCESDFNHVVPDAVPQTTRPSFNLLPPPNKTYLDYDVAFQSAQLHAKSQGYALTVLCDRYGVYKGKKKDHSKMDPKYPRPGRGTKKCGCKMYCIWKLSETPEPITGIWKFWIQNTIMSLFWTHSRLLSTETTRSEILQSFVPTSRKKQMLVKVVQRS